MKRSIITLGLIICAINTFAQWTLVKSFDKAINHIETTDQGVFIATDSTYYQLKDTTTNTWKEFPIYNKIIDLDSKSNSLYIATPHLVYEHISDTFSIQKTAVTIKHLNIYKDNILLTLADGTKSAFCTFSSNFGKLDTLDYATSSTTNYLRTIASDKSVALIGYDNYHGVLIFNEYTQTWDALNPLANEVLYDSFVGDSIIMIRYGKSGQNFYISHNYGKTYKTVSSAFSFCSHNCSVMEHCDSVAYIGYNYTSLKGILESSDNGDTWTETLADSAITGLAVFDQFIFATTANGSVLRKRVRSITTNIKENKNSIKFNCSNRMINNKSSEEIKYKIYDLSGMVVESSSVRAYCQTGISVSQGIYIIECYNQKSRVTRKISIW